MGEFRNRAVCSRMGAAGQGWESRTRTLSAASGVSNAADIATTRSLCSPAVQRDHRFPHSKEFRSWTTVVPPSVRGRNSIQVGMVSVRNQLTQTPYRMPLDDLTKHTFVAGVTGSGKTNTISPS